MKKIIQTFIYLSTAAVIFSCSKDEVNRPLPDPGNKTAVIKIARNAEEFVVYTYNAAGKVTNWISQFKNGSGGYNVTNHDIIYSDGKMIKTTTESGRIEYAYTEDKISKAEVFTINNRKLSTLLFDFNGNQLRKVIEQIANTDPGNIIETSISYTYYDNGNLKRIDFAHRTDTSSSFTLHFSRVYSSYDSKINPEPDGFVLGFYIPGVVLHKNNPVKIDTYDEDGLMDGYSRFEYQYNSKDHPVNRKQFVATGTGAETLFQSEQYSY